MLRQFEYEVLSQAGPELCWQVFTDWDTWDHFAPGIFGTKEWIEGQPWKKGSRARLEQFKPVALDVQILIAKCVPGKEIRFLTHVGGDSMESGGTLEQWVRFHADPHGGTHIHLWLEVAAASDRVDDQDAFNMLRDYKARWYDAFAQYCAKQHQEARGLLARPQSTG